jgi:hypothetical protein
MEAPLFDIYQVSKTSGIGGRVLQMEDINAITDIPAESGPELNGEAAAVVDGEAMADVDGEATSNVGSEAAPNDDGTISEPESDANASFEHETEQQINSAVESLQQIEAINGEVWQTLDAGERLEVLQDIENRMAIVQGRPAVGVAVTQLESNTFGYYDGQGITVNADHLAGNMPVTEFVDTLVHEGRHAYQDYAIRNPDFVRDTTLVSAWAENFAPGNYLTADDYGQELYQGQPIEADAWNYAGHILTSLNKG